MMLFSQQYDKMKKRDTQIETDKIPYYLINRKRTEDYVK